MNKDVVQILTKDERGRLVRISMKWLAPNIDLHGIEIAGQEITSTNFNLGLQINNRDAHVLRAALMVFGGWMDGSPANPEEVVEILERVTNTDYAITIARELLVRLEDWTEE